MGLRWTNKDTQAYRGLSEIGSDAKRMFADWEVGRIEDATPTDVYTSDQGLQLERAAAALNPDGTPAYDIGYDNGAYTVTARGGETGRVAPFKEYLGQRYDSLPQSEQDYQRGLAISKAYGRYGLRDQARAERTAATQDRAANQQYELGGIQKQAAQQGLKKGEYELRNLQRTEEEQQREQELFDIARQFKTGQIDEVTAVQRLAGIHGPIPDGFQGSVSNVNGQPMMVVTNEKTRQSQVVPITGDGATFDRAFSQVRMLLTPKAYNQEREFGLKDREVGAKEVTADAAKKKAETDAAESPSKIRVQEAQANYYGAHGESQRAVVSRENRAASKEEKIDAIRAEYAQLADALASSLADPGAAKRYNGGDSAKVIAEATTRMKALERDYEMLAGKSLHQDKAASAPPAMTVEQQMALENQIRGEYSKALKGLDPDQQYKFIQRKIQERYGNTNVKGASGAPQAPGQGGAAGVAALAGAGGKTPEKHPSTGAPSVGAQSQNAPSTGIQTNNQPDAYSRAMDSSPSVFRPAAAALALPFANIADKLRDPYAQYRKNPDPRWSDSVLEYGLR